ncbi:MAG: ABC transporter substrate-binding protein [Actinomycetota bacterium]
MGLGGRRPLATSGARTVPLLLVTAIVAGACTTPPSRPGPGGGPTPGPTDAATPTPSVARVAISQPGGLDPAAMGGPDDLLLAAQLFDGLVSYAPGTEALVPAAARAWEVEDGGRRFVFHLRRGGRFHDGSPVRAQDFVFAWNRLADPLVAAPYAFLLEPVAGYDRYQRRLAERGMSGLSAPDARTLEVRLSAPWPGFPQVLGHPALSPVPPSADDEEEFALRPVGNGPFRLTGPVVPGGPIVMERFLGYAGSPAGVDQLVFRVFEDREEAWPAFLAGDLEVAPIPPAALADAQGRFGSEGIVTLGRLLYCGLNQLDPRLRSRKLGVAISLAVDRGAIASRVYGGLAVPATGIVPPTIPGAQPDSCGNRCAPDPDRARALVEELPERSRSFALDYASSDTGDALAEVLVAALEAVGLELRPRSHEDRQYAALLQREREEAFCLVWVADAPRQQALLEPLLRSGSPDNHAGFEDRAVDRILERARAERSAARRQALYARAERTALTRMPLVPLVWLRSDLAVQPTVEGFSVDPLGLFDASRLQLGS